MDWNFLCFFFQPRDDHLWIWEKSLGYYYFSTFAIENIVCFHSLKINVKGSIHIKVFLKWEGEKKLPFGLYTAGIFTDHGIKTWGMRYPLWWKPLVLLLFLQNTGQEASFSHFVSKLNFLFLLDTLICLQKSLLS